MGITRVGLTVRWKRHLSSANWGSKTVFHKALRKYGEQSFVVEVLQDDISPADISLFEQEMIIYYDSLCDVGHGYNVSRGGLFQVGPMPEIVRQKIKATKLSQQRKHSPETIEKIKQAVAKHPSSGHRIPHSDETKRKLSAVNRGKHYQPKRDKKCRIPVKENLHKNKKMQQLKELVLFDQKSQDEKCQNQNEKGIN